MSLQKINIRNSVLILMIIGAAATRLLNVNHLSVWGNFTPVGAVAMFGGAYFSDKWKAYLVPLVTLFVSDMLLNSIYYKYPLFYSGFWMVYAAFAIMVLIGSLLKKITVVNVVIGALASVVVHWLITDIDPWLQGTLYAHGLIGYGQSLIAAIPFERNMLLGNLVFSAILFGGFELAKSKYTILRTSKELAV